MFHVCPLCNGIISPVFQCPNCLNPAIDSGKLEDYLGPYAPYQPDDLSEAHFTMQADGSTNELCLHIVYCEHCHTMMHINGMAWE